MKEKSVREHILNNLLKSHQDQTTVELVQKEQIGQWKRRESKNRNIGTNLIKAIY